MSTPQKTTPALFVSVPLSLFRELVNVAEIGEAEAGALWMRDAIEGAKALTPAPMIDRETDTAQLLEHLCALVDCYGVGWKTAEDCNRALFPLMMEAREAIAAHKARTG